MLTEREKTGEKGFLANMRTDSRNAVPPLNQTSGKAVKLSEAFFKADVIFQSVILLASCMVMYYSTSFYLNTRACFSKPLLFLLGKDDVRHNSYKKTFRKTKTTPQKLILFTHTRRGVKGRFISAKRK